MFFRSQPLRVIVGWRLSKLWCFLGVRRKWNMSQLVTAAILHRQMPTDQIRQTRARLEAIVPDDWATRGKLGACEEITDLLMRRPYCRARLIRRAITS